MSEKFTIMPSDLKEQSICECGNLYTNGFRSFNDNIFCGKNCDFLTFCCGSNCNAYIEKDETIKSIDGLDFCSEWCKKGYEEKNDLCECCHKEEYKLGTNALKKCDGCTIKYFYRINNFISFDGKKFCAKYCKDDYERRQLHNTSLDRKIDLYKN